jgi:hypothetical protein
MRGCQKNRTEPLASHWFYLFSTPPHWGDHRILPCTALVYLGSGALLRDVEGLARLELPQLVLLAWGDNSRSARGSSVGDFHKVTGKSNGARIGSLRNRQAKGGRSAP